MNPTVIINFKTYKQGEDVLKLAREIEKVCKKAIIGVQASDIYEIARKTKLRVYAQHIDFFLPGRETGYIIPESVKIDGAEGSFLNHSEHKLSFSVLKKTIKRCNQVGLKTLVFASSVSEAKKIEKLKPDFLVYEPPELVAGKLSVSEAKPEIIKKIREEIKMPFIAGAGIHSRDDVQIAMKLGASGFAVSSAVVLSSNPGKVLKLLLS
ncbi:triose-phosphate isomerase [Candidatus Pacearchaeota archaeon]|nr:triose-phosphate isomerase [Candidatus Pacearchaeota archaeon]